MLHNFDITNSIYMSEFMKENREEVAQVALFNGVGIPFEFCEVPVTSSETTVLVKVLLSTICGSDLHTVSGRRGAEVPCVLGHEAIGTVAAHTDIRSADDKPLQIGDRIIWSLTTSCGECHYCENKILPQKCKSMFKYGHAQGVGENIYSGGFSTYMKLRDGTAIYHIPDSINDAEAAPINCALGTVINGIQEIGTRSGETTVIHGAGMLGLYASCYLREEGYKVVAIVDKNESRLQIAKRFGATHTFNPEDTSANEIDEAIKDITQGHGIDLGVEVSGAASAIPNLVDWLTIGGRCVSLGYVYPLDSVPVNLHQLVTKCISLKAVHNYHPKVLKSALSFIENTRKQYPFAELIGATYPLSEIDDAFEASFRQDTIRVAVKP